MNARTALAKAVFYLAGQLSRIKTPQLTRRMIWDNPDETPRFDDPQRVWMSCRASLRLLDLSRRVDPRHWEHWALDHDDCPVEACPVCEGHVCLKPDEDEEAA